VILDPFQDSGFHDAGWEVIRSAQLDGVAMLLRERSQIALPRLAAEGMSADAAFVDGSHVFHNVFVDLYYLQMIVRRWAGCSRRLLVARGRYGGSLFRDQSGLAAGCVCERHAGTTAALRLPDLPVEPG
jgi:hypothetical protein